MNSAKKCLRTPFKYARSFSDNAESKGLLRLDTGAPDFDTPVHIKNAAKRALDEGFTQYSPVEGFRSLREAIAEKAKLENRIECDSEKEVIVTAGASSAVFCALFSLINPGDAVLTPDPGWPQYREITKLAGGSPVNYPLLEKDRFLVDPSHLRGRIDDKTRMIIINSPHNPTGSVATGGILESIAEIAIKNDLTVISDETYEKIVFGGARHISIAALDEMHERTITIGSLSKTYAMTGWRVGYAIAPKSFIDRMAKLLLYTNACCNTIAQIASISALRGPHDCVSKMVAQYEIRRDFMVKQLNAIRGIFCGTPDGCFFVFPKLDLHVDSMEFADYLSKTAKIAVKPGIAFGRHGERHVRISCLAPISILKSAIEGIKKAVQTMSQ
jgi:aspartate/methionine/tyrosine aminotransferase